MFCALLTSRYQVSVNRTIGPLVGYWQHWGRWVGKVGGGGNTSGEYFGILPHDVM